MPSADWCQFCPCLNVLTHFIPETDDGDIPDSELKWP